MRNPHQALKQSHYCLEISFKIYLAYEILESQNTQRVNKATWWRSAEGTWKHCDYEQKADTQRLWTTSSTRSCRWAKNRNGIKTSSCRLNYSNIHTESPDYDQTCKIKQVRCHQRWPPTQYIVKNQYIQSINNDNYMHNIICIHIYSHKLSKLKLEVYSTEINLLEQKKTSNTSCSI